MKKKYKISDVTKFTIALCLCLSLILVSIVLVNVFTYEEKTAKAETISEDGYSFTFYNNLYDGLLGSNSYFTNNLNTSYWDTAFTYFSYNDRTFTFPDGLKENVHLTSYIYNPSHCYITDIQFGNSGYNYGSRFLSIPVLSDDLLIAVDTDVTNFSNYFGSISVNTSTRAVFYVTYINIVFDFNSSYYDITFGSPSLYNVASQSYNDGYNLGSQNGYDTALSDVGAFNTFGRDNIITNWTNSQSSPTLRFSTNSNAGYDIYAYGVGITPSLGMSFTFDVPLYKGVTYELNYNIANNAGFTPNESFAYFNVGVGVIYNSNTKLLTESPLTGDPVIGMSERFNILNGYSFTPSRDYDKCQFVVIVGYVGGTANTESYLFSVNDITLTSILTYKDGYDKGFADGSSGSSSIVDPNSASYKQGYNDGDSVGYDRGYSAGVQNRYSFATLFTAAIEAPINAVLSGFDVEIMGMNLRNFYLSLFSLAIVIVVIKLILFRRN